METRRPIFLTLAVLVVGVVLAWQVRAAWRCRLVVYNDSDARLPVCRVELGGALLDARPLGAEESREHAPAGEGTFELEVETPDQGWRAPVEGGPGLITIVHLRRDGLVETGTRRTYVRRLWDFVGWADE